MPKKPDGQGVELRALITFWVAIAALLISIATCLVAVAITFK